MPALESTCVSLRTKAEDGKGVGIPFLSFVAVGDVYLDRPDPASASEYESFKARLESLSTGMNSRFEWDRDEIEITAA